MIEARLTAGSHVANDVQRSESRRQPLIPCRTPSFSIATVPCTLKTFVDFNRPIMVNCSMLPRSAITDSYQDGLKAFATALVSRAAELVNRTGRNVGGALHGVYE